MATERAETERRQQDLRDAASKFVYGIHDWRGRSPGYMTTRVSQVWDMLVSAFDAGRIDRGAEIARMLLDLADRYDFKLSHPIQRNTASVLRALAEEIVPEK